MFRSHPLYLVGAVIFAVLLQYLLVRRMNRAMEAKHGEAENSDMRDENQP
jgi:hypothetical protein